MTSALRQLLWGSLSRSKFRKSSPAFRKRIAESGRCDNPDCLIWTLWESNLLDLHILGVQIAGSGGSRRGCPVNPEGLSTYVLCENSQFHNLGVVASGLGGHSVVSHVDRTPSRSRNLGVSKVRTLWESRLLDLDGLGVQLKSDRQESTSSTCTFHGGGLPNWQAVKIPFAAGLPSQS